MSSRPASCETPVGTIALREQLWQPSGLALATAVAREIERTPLMLYEIAARVGVGTGAVDQLVTRNPFAFVRRAGRDGIDRIHLRHHTVTEERLAGILRDMRHFARVSPGSVPVARFWAKGGLGHCSSCGDPLRRADSYGRCIVCKLAAECFLMPAEVA